MNQFVSGALLTGYLVASLFFLRFWKRTRDVLFVFFSIAFLLLGGQRLALEIVGERYEHNAAFYIPRLVAFILILYAIWHKNQESRKQ